MPRPDTGDAREWNPVHWFLRIPIGSRTYERNSQSFQVAVNLDNETACFCKALFRRGQAAAGQGDYEVGQANVCFLYTSKVQGQTHANSPGCSERSSKGCWVDAAGLRSFYICNSYCWEHGSDDRCYPHVGPWYPIRDSGSPAWPSSAPWGPNSFPEPKILRLPHSNLTLSKAQKNMFVNVFQPPNRAQGRTLCALLQFTVDSHEESWVCWVCDEFIFMSSLFFIQQCFLLSPSAGEKQWYIVRPPAGLRFLEPWSITHLFS